MSGDEIAERFKRETAEHVMTVLHDDGLYRHLRFKQPGSPLYWFEIVTAPGMLTFNGDGVNYTFRRVEDMFTFFRSPVGRINPHYWSQKLSSDQDGIKRYDHALLEARVKEALADAASEGELPAGLEQAVREEVLESWDVGTEHGAKRALMEFSFYVDESKRHGHHEVIDGKFTWIPAESPDFEFYEPHEWELCDWDWWFLWALHGIVWGIAQYDAHHGRDPQVARSPRAEAAASRTLAGRPVVTVTLPEPVATATPQGGTS